jgi:hypothetical protein
MKNQKVPKVGRLRIRKGKKNSDSIEELFAFLERNKCFPVIATYLPNMKQSMGVMKGEKYLEIPLLEDLEFELGGFKGILNKIKSWNYPFSAIAEKTIEQGLFD